MAEERDVPDLETRVRELERENKRLRRQVRMLGQERDHLVTCGRKAWKTARIQEEEARRQAVYNRLFLSNCPDLVMVFDRDLTCVLATSSANSIMGLGHEVQLTGEKFTDILAYAQAGRDWAATLVEDCRTVMTSKNIRVREDELATGRGELCLQTRIVPVLDKGGNATGVLLLQHDTTELVIARHKAEAGSRARGQFLATMSHEIRTPMNAIIGMAYLALKAGLPPKQREYVTKIHGAGRSLLGVINDILDFSKIEAGKLSLESASFSLSALLSDVRVLFVEKCTEKGLALSFDVAPDVPDHLIGDRLRLSQVVTNLLSNAVKFTEKGEVALACTLRASSREEAELEITVRDTGKGMDEDTLARLFNPFEQGDTSITRQYGGTGLGMTISRLLVEMMGGSIRVASAPGRGTAMTFSCRMGIDRSFETYCLLPPETLRGARALVISEAPTSLSVFRRMLTDHAMQADTAADPESASMIIQRAMKRGGRYRLILADLQARTPAAHAAQWKRIMEATGGQESIYIDVRPVGLAIPDWPGSGDIIFLEKPLEAATLYAAIDRATYGSDLPRHREEDPAVFEVPRFRGQHVLLVEDNLINQELAAELLIDANLRVSMAGNGLEALDQIHKQTASPPFDLILMDLQMPGMDGYETTRVIRSDPRLACMPIVAMTAHAMVEEKDKCMAAGMNGHVSKPIELEKLYSVLAEFLESADGDKESGEIQIHGYQVRRALAAMGNNKRLYLSMLRRFLERYPAQVEDLPVLVRNWQRGSGPAEMLEFARSLRSLSATLGHESLEQCGCMLETLSSRKPEEASTAMVEIASRVAAEMRGAILSAARYLAEQEGYRAEHLPVSLASRLLSLEDRLKARDVFCLDRLPEYLDGLGELQPDLARQLGDAARSFAFEKGIALVREARESLSEAIVA